MPVEITPDFNPLRIPSDRRLNRIAGPSALVIFGVTGDLSRKKLMPAVYDLANRGLLPPGFAPGRLRPARLGRPGLRGRGRTTPSSSTRAPPSTRTSGGSSRQGIRFVQGEFDDDAAFDRLKTTLDELDATRGTMGNHAFYLSIPPKSFPLVTEQLRRSGLAEQEDGQWRRVVIEKPFGSDLKTARELNDVVESVFPPDSVFRIDHYLGKETVQNILALRFANQLYEPIWNANYVDHVQITMAEDIGVGGRAGYYDGIGAARDVIQNHLLQLLALTAMEEPVSFDAADLRAEKEKVLSAVHLPKDLSTGDRARAVLGRLAGRREGARLPRGGRDEPEVGHRDLRRDPPRHQHPPLGRRAVLPARRQAPRPPRHRDRRRVQARAAVPVRGEPDLGARSERPRDPRAAG